LRTDQLVFRSTPPKTGVRFIFVVDSSGSQGAQQRMRAVKGAVAGLLETSVDQKDEIAVISFRGAKAEIVLQPCIETAVAARLLEFLPTGGRTPLAHALQLANSVATPNSLLILLTDGRANVPLHTTDPWGDALEMAGNVTCPALLIDSSLNGSSADATKSLASAMRATLIHIEDLNQETLLRVVST
jgi:magnesium chelatase subunit D